MEQPETQILRFETVEPIFRFYLNLWPNDIVMTWARVAWQAVEESGKANYSNDNEELTVGSYAVALSLVYYEYCHRSAWHEDRSFSYWTDDVLKDLRNDLGKDTEKIGRLLFDATRPLFDKIGDRELAAELWINCIESSRGFIGTPKEKAEVFSRFVNNGEFDPMYSGGDTFVGGIMDDLSQYHSVSGLGIFDC